MFESTLHLSLLFGAATVCLLANWLARREASAFLLALLLGFLALLTNSQVGDGLVTFSLRGREIFYLDPLNLWLLPYTVLIHLVVLLCAPRAEMTPAWIRNLLLGLLADLMLFSLRDPLWIAFAWIFTHLGLALSLAPVFADGKERRFRRILLLYLGGGCLALVGGILLLPWRLEFALPAITLGIVLRKALVPFHPWLPVLFERAPLGQVIAFCAPQVGAYVTVRLLAPRASEALLVTLGAFALVTALHGACLAFGQKSFRGVYAGLFMGQTSLVFAGLQCLTLPSLVGGLTVWLSGGLSLTGLGLCVWALLARRGKMDLKVYHGGYERSPVLATCFLIFGLASCGFPGTLGFIAQDLLLQGTTLEYPTIGVLTAVVTALNGTTVMRTYFLLFCGSSRNYAASQSLRPREKMAMLVLLAILLGFGLRPASLLGSRLEAGSRILMSRHRLGLP